MRSVGAFVASFLAVTLVTALLLGASAMAAYGDDGCNDDNCSVLHCEMAAGGTCASPCAHAMAAIAHQAIPANPVRSTPSFDNAHHDLRPKDRLFRPPILA